MYEKVISRIIEASGRKNSKDVFPVFSSGDCTPIKIDSKNFMEITPVTGKKVAFIDGGNAEILNSPDVSLSVIRTCFAVFDGNKKISSKKEDFVLLVTSSVSGNDVRYDASVFSNDGKEIRNETFDSMDETLKEGVVRADIKKIPNVMRRFAELNLAKSACEMEVDMIIIDGSLQCTLPNEEKYMEELQKLCLKKGVVLCALGKTNSLFASNGMLVSSLLESISPDYAWGYHPVADIKDKKHMAEISFVKLHEKSKHIFKLEIFIDQKEKLQESVGIIASNAKDPVFIGYPYGLVEADRNARVSNSEKDALKARIMLALESKGLKTALGAHEILDKISF
jgi:hypothetical protein